MPRTLECRQDLGVVDPSALDQLVQQVGLGRVVLLQLQRVVPRGRSLQRRCLRGSGHR